MKSLKNFGIVFAVSFVVLGIVALFTCNIVADAVCSIFEDKEKAIEDILVGQDTTGIGNEGVDDRLTRPLNGDSFTWLLIVSDYRPAVFDNYYPQSAKNVEKLSDFGILDDEYRLVEATDILLIRADVETREYILMSFPVMTRVDTPAGKFTLGELYARSGAAALSDKISSMTGLLVNYYSVMHSTELASVANLVGSIECNIPVDIWSDGKNYISAVPEAEETEKAPDKKDEENEEDEEEKISYTEELDASSSVKLAKKLIAALLYRDDSDGIDDEMLILQSFGNGLMNNLASLSESGLKTVFNGLKDKFVKTNITASDVLACSEVIKGYSWFKVTTLTYPGKYLTPKAGRPGYYNPDIDGGISYFADYR
ncbi:MAG: hypothetical protein E7575_00950 [Ruminococcaceae bacterium]|nr:hypothetical protein [Oscillospiraceae bacterium]